MSDFGPQPDDREMRAAALALCRLTRWGLNEVLALSYGEALWWLEGAIALEEEIRKG